jgi:hypothetical protein
MTTLGIIPNQSARDDLLRAYVTILKTYQGLTVQDLEAMVPMICAGEAYPNPAFNLKASEGTKDHPLRPTKRLTAFKGRKDAANAERVHFLNFLFLKVNFFKFIF